MLNEGALVDMGLLSDASLTMTTARTSKIQDETSTAMLGTHVRTAHRLLSAAIIVVVMVSHALGLDAIPDQLYVQGVAIAGLFAVVLQLRQPRWLVGDRLKSIPMPEAPRR
jgi:hypothetical protein